MSSELAVGDRILAFYWTRRNGGDGRWSNHRRRHRVTSIDPLQGVEYWYEQKGGYTEGKEHRLNLEHAEHCDVDGVIDTGRDGKQRSDSRRRVDALYRPPGADGEIVLYAGDLLLTTEHGQQHRIPGQLELRIAPRPTFTAHIVGDFARLSFLMRPDEPDVLIPPDARLDPPQESALPERVDEASRVDRSISLNHIQAGDMSVADRFVLHISGALTAWLPTVDVAGGFQQQLSFTLPGWELTLGAVSRRGAHEDFGFVIEATPMSRPARLPDVEKLHRRLFFLLSLIASREVGVGPVCGVDGAEGVIWLDCGPLRVRPGPPGVRWCPNVRVSSALPKLAEGFAAVSADEAMERVLHRAINHLLAASGQEVLDVRIPVACAGLELLGWAILQRQDWLGTDALSKLSAGTITRLLLQWASVPVAIPDHFTALAARRSRISQASWAAPEVLFNVRNALVHPPKRLDEPEWPSSDELVESWQLATWYLELVLLRLLEYDGDYWSRLRLNRSANEVEPVPWARRDPT